MARSEARAAGGGPPAALDPSAIDALACFGPEAGAATPKIRELEPHKDENVRKAATAALAKIQPAK